MMKLVFSVKLQIDFCGGSYLLLLVVLVVVTGVKQGQLLVPRLKSELGIGVLQ